MYNTGVRYLSKKILGVEMQIGEFAKVCNTKISVLRHYDKEGLLRPDYIDRFTGYRYYSNEQIDVYAKITVLKDAGFTLSEIRSIMAENIADEAILDLFERKKEELQKTLINLSQAKRTIIGVEAMKISILQRNEYYELKTEKIAPADILSAYERLDQKISEEGYQRISGFRTYGERFDDAVEIACDAVKLLNEEIPLNEDTTSEFENDEVVVGKWEIVGEFAVKEDFFAGTKGDERYMNNRDIYLLPGGEQYWCYSWTKGKLFFRNGHMQTANDYEIEIYDGERYMFVDYKSYNYRHGGKTTVLVLRQIDNNAYSVNEFARKDNIDMPFVDDATVIGKWKAVGFCKTKDDFVPDKCTNNDRLFFASVEFKPLGEIISYYGFGDKVISSRDMQEWTKGFVLRKWNETACAYEMIKANGKDHLIMEWKSGDYLYGGFDTDYYVFVRE